MQKEKHPQKRTYYQQIIDLQQYVAAERKQEFVVEVEVEVKVIVVSNKKTWKYTLKFKEKLTQLEGRITKYKTKKIYDIDNNMNTKSHK